MGASPTPQSGHPPAKLGELKYQDVPFLFPDPRLFVTDIQSELPDLSEEIRRNVIQDMIEKVSNNLLGLHGIPLKYYNLGELQH